MTKMIKAMSVAALVAAPLSGYSSIQFSDDFESGLGQWNPGQGILVNDSDASHGKVLTFTGKNAGGDASTSVFTLTGVGGLIISFDYKGGGGYIGFGLGSNNWIAGEAGYGSAIPFTALDYGGDWHHYDLPIPAGITGPIIVEDYQNSNFSGAFFDNIVVSDAPVNAPDGGSTALLLAMSLGGIGLLRRNRK